PVLKVLGTNKRYKGANDEFLSAHEHYRHKRYKECLNDCLKSFESLMKSIHEIHSWTYNPNDTAKKLINSCLVNNLVPEYLQNQFSSVRILLESGIPTVRNKEGGHGQGSEVTKVPEHLASYTLHLTATNLLFLVKCEEQYS
ncbi:MAG: abortive infection family protein, partial [Gammaproteobacteria bacterium]|nr:abortive infection family protein [Gammaproteobacteria bacterium]